MTKDEARKLAKELDGVIADVEQGDGFDDVCLDTVKYVRDVLAEQPAQQQEPVAWMWRCKPYCDWPKWSVSLKRPADSGRDGHKRTEGYEDVPLYTSPPPRKPWVGLTDVEIQKEFHPLHATGLQFARAIEAKLREKNAQPSKPLTDVDQIAEALRRHGLTLVKTAHGYDVMNLGQITAHGIKGDA